MIVCHIAIIYFIMVLYVLLRLTASDYSFLYLQTVPISFLKEKSEKNVKMIEDLPGESKWKETVVLLFPTEIQHSNND